MTLDTAKTLAEWMAAYRAEHWRADMKPSEALRRVRELLSHGWSEPFSTDERGLRCLADDEAIAMFCVDDALITVAKDEDAAVVLELEVQRQLRATGSNESLCLWLQAPARTLADVQQLLATTERRLAIEESRHV